MFDYINEQFQHVLFDLEKTLKIENEVSVTFSILNRIKKSNFCYDKRSVELFIRKN